MMKKQKKLIAFIVTVCMVVTLAAPWASVSFAAETPAITVESTEPAASPPGEEPPASTEPPSAPKEEPSASAETSSSPAASSSAESTETPEGSSSTQLAEAPPSASPEPVAADLAALLELARTDGAAAAETLNQITDDETFQTYTYEVLKLYYGEELYSPLGQFLPVIDARAAQLLADFEAAKAERDQASQLDYVPGEVLVTFQEEDPAAQVEAAVAAMDETPEEASVTPIADSLALVEIPLDQTVDQAIGQLEQSGGIAYAQPNYLIHLAETSDGESGTQATVNDPNAGITDSWYLYKIDTLKAWDYVDALPHSKVKVAVLDSGVDITHEDLQANLNKPLCVDVTQAASAPYPALVSDKAVNGNHGTHVTGIVGATANNEIGVAGVGTSQDNSVLDLFVVCVFKANGSGSTSDVIKGITYAVQSGAKVINMSLGAWGTNTALTTEVNKAVAAGVTVVCSAGNGDDTTGYVGVENPMVPSDIPSVISVINTRNFANPTDANIANIKSSGSNFGDAKWISAPGENILSTQPGNTYATKWGTSMSSPAVAGVVAMMLSVNPSLTPAQVKTILANTATDLYTPGKDKYTGYGNVNASAAVLAALKARGVGAGNNYAVNFDSNGAAVAAFPKSRMALSPNTTLSALPSAPTLDGYAFGGWTYEKLPVPATTKGTPFTASTAVTADVTVYARWIYVVPSTSVTVSPTSLNLLYGEGRQLNAAMLPLNTTDNVTWTTSNASVAAVNSSGYITAAMSGTAVITATTDSGKTAQCRVTVTFPDTIEGFVTRLYVLVLGRKPDVAGFNGWVSALRSGAYTGTVAGYGFFCGPEYVFKNKSNADFVEDLYNVMLNRKSDVAGKNAWVDALDKGMSRDHVYFGFANSAEFGLRCQNAGIVQGYLRSAEPRDQNYNVTSFMTRMYRNCLGRNPDVAGLNGWTDVLLNYGWTGRRVAYSFFFSPEYLYKNTTDEQYVETLYNVMLDRKSDVAGKNAWVNALKIGYSREHIFNQFVNSAEFLLICERYGINPG